jgi:hypothetical protein
MAALDPLAPEYRYVLTDLMSNTVIGELPFTDVTYGRGLKAAGSFSGTTPVILGKTNGYDLYETTLPGRTGLYVLRNNVCVWGGIIWTRDYDLKNRALTVSGQEFTSYLYHRNIWKTFISDYGVTAVANAGGDYIDLTLTTTSLSAGFLAPGSTVQLVFSGVGTAQYNDTYEVLFQQDNNLVRVKADVAGVTLTHIRLAGKVVTVWTSAKHNLRKGNRVRISGTSSGGTNKDLYNGVKTVKAVLNDTCFSYSVDTKNTKTWTKKKTSGKASRYDKITPGTYTGVTMRVRTDTYDYVKGMLNAVFNDFTDIEFAIGNEPGVSYALGIASRQLVSGVATITTDDPHDIAEGQQVFIRNLHPSLNGLYEVTEVPSTTSFRYQQPGLPSLSLANVSPNERVVLTRARKNLVATLTTSTNHNFVAGDLVTVDGVDKPTNKTAVYDGTFVVAASPAPTARSFSYKVLNNSVSKNDEKGTKTGTGVALETPGSGTATVYQQVIVGTGGSFPRSANIGIELEVDSYSGVNVTPVTHRGGAADNVGEALSSYADSTSGFEYRIDCDYDADLQLFTRTFRLLQIDLPDPPPPGEVSPISRFGADRVVFEYPGNIASLSINESAENAATRMFVTGSTAGAAGNPYYAAAAAVELLNPQDGSRAWPLLDAVQSMSEEGNQTTLYGYAERYLREARPPVMSFTITVSGSIDPIVGTYQPGDWCSVVVQDDFVQARLRNSLEPRDTALVRKIQNLSVQVPNGPAFPEIVTLQLVPEWQVDSSAD